MRLPRLLSWLKAPSHRPIRTRSANRFRPGIEVLEDRCVPAVFNVVVDTNSDYSIATAPSGFVSLRQAILIADAHEASNPTDTSVISFSHTLYYFAKADSSTAVVNLDNFTTNKGLLLTYTDPTIQPADAPLPTVTGNVTIDGGRVGQNPMTIDGGFDPTVPNPGVQIFTIGAGANVTIQNFILQNSDANETPTLGTFAGGQGAFVQNGGTPPAGDPALGGTVFLLNDSFNTSYAQFGGALYNGLGDNMIVEGGTFSSNDGAADSYLSIDEQPPLAGQGGAIFNAGTLTFGSTNTFNSDYAPDSGGAIYNSGTMNVTGSIDQFSVDQSFEGGAVYNSITGKIAGPMTGWSFITNTAYDNGGAIWNNSANSLTLASDTFSTNNADTNGGAVYNIGAGGLFLNDGTAPTKAADTFTSNKALNDGGAIYNTSSLTLTATAASAASAATFTTNTALFSGGAIWNSGAKMSLDFVNINGLAGPSSTGFDAGNGGGVYTGTGTATLNNVQFTNNNAGGNLFLNGEGGGLYVSSGNVTVTNSTFTGNTANDTSRNGREGGALYVGAGTVSLNGTTSFTGNQANLGGAVFLNSGNLTVNTGVAFGTAASGNSATDNGGAINVQSGTLSVQGATFTNNSAASSGGAVYISSSNSASIAGSTFTTNTANNGGALWNSSLFLSLTQDTFGTPSAGNVATAGGGAIFNQGALNATAISLIGNSANSGGGIYNSGTATLINSTLAHNTAANGGGAYNASGALEFVNATLAFNAASTTGGGIYNGASLSLLNTIVAQDTAPGAPDIGSNANVNFVDSLYLSLLGRAADAGAASWIGLLNTGTSPSSVVQGIEGSTEYLQDQVKSLYLKYLGRAADSGGLSYFSGFLASGGTIEQVIDDLVGSSEYFTLHGSSNNNFVAALYSEILGRTGSLAEVGYWVGVLTSGATQGQVAAAFLASQEYRTDLVESYYSTYLGRAADSGGLNYFLGQLNAGVADQVVLAAILGSPEGVADQSPGTTFALLSHNLIGDNSGSGIAANVGNGNLVGTSTAPLNPAFTSSTAASVNGSPPVLVLSKTSPAIDQGSNSVLNPPFNLTTDETGAPRFQGLNVDIGAVESAFTAGGSGGTGSNSGATVFRLLFGVPPRTTTTFSATQVINALAAAGMPRPGWPVSQTLFQIIQVPPVQLGTVLGRTTLNITPVTRSNFTFTFQLLNGSAPSQHTATIFGFVYVVAGSGLVEHA